MKKFCAAIISTALLAGMLLAVIPVFAADSSAEPFDLLF